MMSASEPTEATHEVSFDQLVRDERVGLLRFAYLLCGDHHRAEDAVAEALARTWPRWRSGGIDDPKAYVRRAIVNELRGRARRAGVRRRHDDRRVVEPAVAVLDHDAVQRDLVHEALLQLPLRQRAAVVLRFYEDRSEQQTADLLGVSPGTVKTHVHRALEQLRTLLEEDQ
jgi:RNA polymerase sigma-70 factor (sigma-E family)